MRTGSVLSTPARNGGLRCTVSNVCACGAGSLALLLANPANTSGGIPDFPLRMLSIIDGLMPAPPSVPMPLKLELVSAAEPSDDFPKPAANPGCSCEAGSLGFAFARKTCGGDDG